MWVHEEVGDDSVLGEGHVALVYESADDSLLAVPGCEFISQLGYLLGSDGCSDQEARVEGFRYEYVIHPAMLADPDAH